MRTRARTMPQSPIPSAPLHFDLRSDPGGSVIYTYPGPDVIPETPLGELDEIIEDDTSRAYGVRGCNHTVNDRKIFSCMLGSKWQDGAGYREYYDGAYSLWRYLPIPPKLSLENLGVTYPKTVEQLRNECLKAFYGDNETDNLLNLLEADQLVSGVQGVYDFLKRFFNPSSGLTLKRKFSKTKALPSNINPLDFSNLLLGWSFGFAPLISDLKKISRAIPQMRTRLREMVLKSGNPYRTTRSCQGSFNFSYPSGYNGYGPESPGYPTGWWHERITPVTSPTRIVGVKGKRIIPFDTIEFKELDYIMRKFVATGPVALAWEKVPFSFVVDWFVDLSGLIIRLDQEIKPTRILQECWSSEAVEAFVSVVKHSSTAAGSFRTQYDGQDVAQHRLKYYSRSPLKPEFLTLPSNRFGKKQGTLLAALFHQNVANLARRLRATR